MTIADKRKAFLIAQPKINPVDSLPYITEAEPNCTKCNGMGIVDTGDYSPCFEKCSMCWFEPRTAAGSLD